MKYSVVGTAVATVKLYRLVKFGNRCSLMLLFLRHPPAHPPPSSVKETSNCVFQCCTSTRVSVEKEKRVQNSAAGVISDPLMFQLPNCNGEILAMLDRHYQQRTTHTFYYGLWLVQVSRWVRLILRFFCRLTISKLLFQLSTASQNTETSNRQKKT